MQTNETLGASEVLCALAEDFIESKRAESDAQQKRIQIEEKIISLLGQKQEGSETHALKNGMKITITGKLTYSANMPQLTEICNSISPDLRPIKMEPKLDEAGAKYLRANNPDVWAKVAQAITIKPAKTAVTLKA